MKAGKYVEHKFTKPERKAQKIYRRADSQQLDIVDALKSCNFYMSREDMHKRLDRRLDTIEKMRARARDMFPKVEESFTIATIEIAL